MRPLLMLLIATMVVGCGTPRPRTLIMPAGATNAGTWIEGLAPCRRERGEVVYLDPDRPLTLFVPGASFAAGGFQALAQIFEAHGQQTLCFHYDDRDRLETASAQLIVVLEALENYVPLAPITIFGHSQGGLVGRHALVGDRYRPLRVLRGREINLVTVASPFHGITSATTCGFGWLHILSLGMTAAVCQSVAGSKWHDIYPGSRFMRHPGSLGSFVKRHVMIVTDERGACLERARDGDCVEADHTFSLDEQYSNVVEADRRVATKEVKAGHTGVLGERDAPPRTLIRILEAQQILTTTAIASYRTP